MALRLNKVHNYDINMADKTARLLSENHYVRLVHRDEPKTPGEYVGDSQSIICQGGKFYGDGGDEILRDDIPDWFWKAAANITRQKRDKIKMTLPPQFDPATAEAQEADEDEEDDNDD
jgi:hypothetical protein